MTLPTPSGATHGPHRPREADPLLVLVREPGHPHQPRAPARTTARSPGTGKLVILPGRPGLRARPVRSFAANPDAYDPDYLYQLAIDSGCNAYAAPLGSLEQPAAKFAGQVPLILKVNNSDTLVQGGAVLGHHLLGRGRAAPRLRGHRLHHLPRLPAPQHAVPGPPGAHPRGQAQGPGRGGVELPARHRHVARTARRPSTSPATRPPSPPSSAPTSSRSSRRPPTSSRRRRRRSTRSTRSPSPP